MEQLSFSELEESQNNKIAYGERCRTGARGKGWGRGCAALNASQLRIGYDGQPSGSGSGVSGTTPRKHEPEASGTNQIRVEGLTQACVFNV